MPIRTGLGLVILCCAALTACTAGPPRGPSVAVTAPAVGRPPPPSSVEAAQLEAVTRKSTFRKGTGLPGRVWETGAPAYIPDVGQDDAFRRADTGAGQASRAEIGRAHV